jgi:hypothetical protein
MHRLQNYRSIYNLRGAKIGRGVRVTPDDVRKYVEQRMKGKK